ncbi:MAG TPA: cysteine desulfurase NifS [Clostridia bacterium]|nr:cysteine desulfurase NifS [Clostridia bacterium]HPY43307.1 cysteine desulfurase NifS [Clostridia bacterium]HQA96491.1 cysteine desulfurase NifS [Clostridia bacterium]HQO54826.1 cysteine desulfurase NifS [Clostridia bacterium]HUM61316.1 cysteine desulfurase NifS [Clostridia bacterium]
MGLNRIYLDNAATTQLDEVVLEQMLPWLRERYGNASSVYQTGREARKAVEEARRQVARALNCTASEVFFTGSGTESDNWAIKGAAWAHQDKGRHIVSTMIEHHAVLHTLHALEKQGFSVTYVPVNEFGRVSPEDIRDAMRDDTILVSVMAANNEIGTLQPIAQIGQIAKAQGVLFHTDAVQAVGAIPVDVEDWQVDLLSLSAHKFHGPKGAGALYVRKGVRLEPLLHGGAQERNRRAGTENLPGIVGLGKAIELACEDIEGKAQAVTELRDMLIAGILANIPQVRLNGDPVHRLPNNVNISVRFVEGEALLLRLDLAGIAASSGSACTSGSLDPSHVLLAIGLPHEIAHGSLRLSLSKRTTREEIEEVLRVLGEVVRKLREMSPLYDEGEADVF